MAPHKHAHVQLSQLLNISMGDISGCCCTHAPLLFATQARIRLPASVLHDLELQLFQSARTRHADTPMYSAATSENSAGRQQRLAALAAAQEVEDLPGAAGEALWQMASLQQRYARQTVGPRVQNTRASWGLPPYSR